MERCRGIKKDGKQCTRNGPYCYQHKAAKKNKCLEPLPGTRLDVVKKINKAVETVKPQKDSGYIYVFRLEGDTELRYKIGRTKRDPIRRIKEWADVHYLPIVSEVIFEVPVGCKWVERMIHWYLDQYRLIRYEGDRGLFTEFWYATRIPLIAGTEPGVAMHKHVEWFTVELKTIEALIGTLIHFIVRQQPLKHGP
jgi:hypothetical protein